MRGLQWTMTLQLYAAIMEPPSTLKAWMFTPTSEKHSIYSIPLPVESRQHRNLPLAVRQSVKPTTSRWMIYLARALPDILAYLISMDDLHRPETL